jgi:hypothetical protein
MSIRENIASNLKTTLESISSPITFKKVSRMPFDPEEIADTQFPSIYIQTAGKRSGTIDYVLVGYVKGSDANIDTLRNQLIEVIEETLDTDRTRGGYAKETKIINIDTDAGRFYPFGECVITVRIFYEFTRGTA